MRIRVSIGILLLLVGGPLAAESTGGGEDGDPCFAQASVDTLAITRTPAGILLTWEAAPEVSWYEILRCQGQPAACKFLSLTPSTETEYEDDEVPAADYVGYRIAGIVDPDDNGCGISTYCSLDAGQCGGDGVCSLHCELCDPLPFDPVCGCDGDTYANGCEACAAGANIRYDGPCNP